MDLVTLKVLAVLLLVFVCLSVGLAPLFVCRNFCRSPWVDIAVASCLSFAGGVMLATFFIHLIPQVRGALRFSLPEHSLPVTELLMIAGFFLTFFLDEACVSFRSSSKVYPESTSESQSPAPSLGPRFRHVFATRGHNLQRAALLALHALAKGVAVSLADSIGDLWFLGVATGVHESVMVMGFTLHLMKLGEPMWLAAALGVFVVVAMVVGLVVGIVLTSTGLDPVVVAVMRGLAAGNILYVTFYELLSREVRARALGLLAFFVALMGFLAMLVIHLFGKGFGATTLADNNLLSK